MSSSKKNARKRTSKAAPSVRVASEAKPQPSVETEGKEGKETPKPAKLGKAADARKVLAHIFPTKVEFFHQGEKEPYSRIANGAYGSDAFAQVSEALKQLDEDGVTVELHKFDAQGNKLAP